MPDHKFNIGQFVYNSSGIMFMYMAKVGEFHFGRMVRELEYETDHGAGYIDHEDDHLTIIRGISKEPPIPKLAEQVKDITHAREEEAEALNAVRAGLRDERNKLRDIQQQTITAREDLKKVQDEKIPLLSELIDLLDGAPMWAVRDMGSQYGPVVFSMTNTPETVRLVSLTFHKNTKSYHLTAGNNDTGSTVVLYRSEAEAQNVVKSRFDEIVAAWENNGSKVTGFHNDKPKCEPLIWLSRNDFLVMPDSVRDAEQAFINARREKKIEDTKAALRVLEGEPS